MAGLLGRFIGGFVGGAAQGATEVADSYIKTREAGTLSKVQADIEEQKQMRIAENSERIRREGQQSDLAFKTNPANIEALAGAESSLTSLTAQSKADASSLMKRAEYDAVPQAYSEGTTLMMPDKTRIRIPKTSAPGAAADNAKGQRAATKAALDSITRDISALRRERAASYDEAVTAEIDAQLADLVKEAAGYRKALGGAGLDVPDEPTAAPPPALDLSQFDPARKKDSTAPALKNPTPDGGLASPAKPPAQPAAKPAAAPALKNPTLDGGLLFGKTEITPEMAPAYVKEAQNKYHQFIQRIEAGNRPSKDVAKYTILLNELKPGSVTQGHLDMAKQVLSQ